MDYNKLHYYVQKQSFAMNSPVIQLASIATKYINIIKIILIVFCNSISVFDILYLNHVYLTRNAQTQNHVA